MFSLSLPKPGAQVSQGASQQTPEASRILRRSSFHDSESMSSCPYGWQQQKRGSYPASTGSSHQSLKVLYSPKSEVMSRQSSQVHPVIRRGSVSHGMIYELYRASISSSEAIRRVSVVQDSLTRAISPVHIFPRWIRLQRIRNHLIVCILVLSLLYIVLQLYFLIANIACIDSHLFSLVLCSLIFLYILISQLILFYYRFFCLIGSTEIMMLYTNFILTTFLMISCLFMAFSEFISPIFRQLFLCPKHNVSSGLLENNPTNSGVRVLSAENDSKITDEKVNELVNTSTCIWMSKQDLGNEINRLIHQEANLTSQVLKPMTSHLQHFLMVGNVLSCPYTISIAFISLLFINLTLPFISIFLLHLVHSKLAHIVNEFHTDPRVNSTAESRDRSSEKTVTKAPWRRKRCSKSLNALRMSINQNMYSPLIDLSANSASIAAVEDAANSTVAKTLPAVEAAGLSESENNMNLIANSGVSNKDGALAIFDHIFKSEGASYDNNVGGVTR
ncbi:unnamed protein product, partial [Protopolystoma xenopodis]